jgi:hypothetical protein
MLHRIKTLQDCTVHATDGVVGRFDRCYFDSDQWAVRYLVVDTGVWLPGREVLIPPLAVTEIQNDARTIQLSMPRIKIEKSPAVGMTSVPTREQEALYLTYYGYPLYWEGAGLWGQGTPPLSDIADLDERRVRAAHEFQLTTAALDVIALHDSEDVIGCHIHATDGAIGHAEDFIVEDASWLIRYAMMDTSNWWMGRKVLIAPQWVTNIDWGRSIVEVGMTKEAIKSSPEFDSSKPIDRQYETELYGHYERPGYWVD